MKPSSAFTFSIAAIAASLSALALTGCNKNDRNDASAKAGVIMADTKEAMSHGWDNVKSFSFEKRDDFNANSKAIGAKWDAQMSELRASYSEAKASASRKSAMAELKDSETAYKEKLAALGTATAATWDSAKQNVLSAWDRLQASYYKARAE
ncbi:MAG: hypothetical protein NTU80_13475 [Verrucomicrobia bacterium]|nr:hypothetical protein [Verrucomicrobiota bacterium]